ncbi:conserved hypothetical protein [uncultured Gammaproteobacteria bacterium]
MLDSLYGSLSRRLRPEDVAQIIRDHHSQDLSPAELGVLDKAAAGSLKRGVGRLTSMSEDFFEASPPRSHIAVAQGLFKTARAMTAADCTDLDCLADFVAELSVEIHKQVGQSSFKYDRLNRTAREGTGLDLSKRRYNKMFRFLLRFEEKIERYRRELRRADLRQIAKSGLVRRISREDFDAAGAAAPFVAYYVARLNRRGMFTVSAQDRAFDEVAAMLFRRFKRAPTAAGWRIISLVMPDFDIVSYLSDEDKIKLFADWLALLGTIAQALKECADQNGFDRAAMIVRPGNDSSTWNAAAGAWNLARQGWLGTLHALGMEDMLEFLCPGKAMRLMAADVARWHAAQGGSVHQDTAVWAVLPAPWEVFSGQASCARADVEAACARFGVDPAASGWTAPRGPRQAVPFRPTPELVHGVAVSQPHLALVLRKAGWFSGKSARPLPEGVAALVTRDATGAAISAESAVPETPDPPDPGLWGKVRCWFKCADS